MSEILKVEHFGPIRKAELELKKTTVLIGPQGSGKSTLAKLVAIFNNNYYLLTGNADFAFVPYGMTKYFTARTKVSFSNSWFTAWFTKADNLQKNIEKIRLEKLFALEDYKKKRNRSYLLPETSAEIFLIWEYPSQLRKLFRMSDEEFENNKELKEFDVKNELGNLLNEISGTIKYIPTERFFISSISDSLFNLLKANVGISKSIIDFGSDFEVARKENSFFPILFLGIAHDYRDNSSNIITLKNGSKVSLSESASGYQAIIPLMQVVDHFSKEKKLWSIIEEPELNLYPNSQKELIYYLCNKGTMNDNKLTITTHSPYVLSALNNLLFAFQVAKKYPDKANEVDQIIPKESWLNPAEFAAYYVGDGTVRSIVNPKTGMISENELDTASELIGEEFDNLMDIYRTPLHAHTNS